MCGRYVLASPGEVIAAHFRLAQVPEYAPRYNIAPTQAALVVRETPAGEREAVLLRWGLVPSWAKDPAIGSRMINARAEGLADMPSFRAAFRRPNYSGYRDHVGNERTLSYLYPVYPDPQQVFQTKALPLDPEIWISQSCYSS